MEKENNKQDPVKKEVLEWVSDNPSLNARIREAFDNTSVIKNGVNYTLPVLYEVVWHYALNSKEKNMGTWDWKKNVRGVLTSRTTGTRDITWVSHSKYQFN
ncbi:hypothetical protein GLW08_20415 [Pontibacillus yanchengensis]|uniref:Uncharacterized protein n=2 Tax=Pontibacillus yanchengensis TaxID=462910 RepID=A0ACC7VMG5_9BACI|nr:hypothetical protein [Pontibacillus yanchengensis]MYL35469.1 hypothetical protein [Pontibacillus yanchengensis]MYL55669.1 hypothetical protein [Pontibacillus yanchengensis]